MAFPRKLLNPGEEIVLDTLPNWSLLAAPVGLSVLLIGALVAILVATSQHLSGWFGWLFLVLFVGDMIYLAARVISWRASNLVVTTHRVVYRHGVFSRQSREIPIESIQDVSYKQTIFERMVGAGALTIESAGRQGQEPFPDVSHPAKIQSTINQLIDQSRHREQARYAGAPALSVPEQIEKLAELAQRGIITEEEFQRKKASLLGEM